MTDSVTLAVSKAVSWIHVTDETQIDAGLIEAPPLTSAERREQRIDARKRAIIRTIAAPFGWVSELGHGAEWLQVEVMNGVAALIGSNSRYAHESRDDDGYDW